MRWFEASFRANRSFERPLQHQDLQHLQHLHHHHQQQQQQQPEESVVVFMAPSPLQLCQCCASDGEFGGVEFCRCFCHGEGFMRPANTNSVTVAPPAAHLQSSYFNTGAEYHGSVQGVHGGGGGFVGVNGGQMGEEAMMLCIGQDTGLTTIHNHSHDF